MKYTGPLTRGFISIVKVTILHGLHICNQRYRGIRYPGLTIKLHLDFEMHGGPASLTSALFVGQQDLLSSEDNILHTYVLSLKCELLTEGT